MAICEDGKKNKIKIAFLNFERDGWGNKERKKESEKEIL